MVFMEDESIRIYDGRYKKRLTDDDIWWQWDVRGAKDKRFRQLFSKTKNDAKQVLFRGELHLLVISSRGNGVGLIHFDSGTVSYFRRVPGSIHSATVTPRDNILLADSKGYIKLLSTSTGKIDQCRHSSPHGVVWDKKQDVAWVWGGSQMGAYKIYGTKDRPLIECGSREMFIGPKGGHDLQPMLDGTSTMIASSGPDILFFESDLEWHGLRFGMLQAYPGGKGIKGVSRNQETGEIVYVRNDRSNNIKYRSNVIRSLDGRTRSISGGSATYKVRWWQKNCFSW
jgi:hypothetical protein